MKPVANWTDLANFALLFVLAAVFAEVVDRVERLHRYLADSTGSFINPSGIWLIAGALVLPFNWAIALPVLIGAHTLLRNHRTRTGRAYRTVYTIATELLASAAAYATFHAAAGAGDVSLSRPTAALGVVAAIAAYWLVNSVLVLSVMWLVAAPERFRDLLLTPDEELLEVATLCLGALLAVSLVHSPVLCPMTLALMVVLRRSALVRELQQQATHDARTGLLNAGAWRAEADRELTRSARTGSDVSLLMIDLDHFKALNDTHGHQAGDAALKAVADCLTETLRGYDALGRYGGEEFAALLVDADELTGEAVAERVCAKIRDLAVAGGIEVRASIGVATSRAARTDVESLVARADAALYQAKREGRDRVRAAAPVDAGVAIVER